MYTHLVSFRIEKAGRLAADYDKRYQSLIEAALKLDPGHWDDTTSFLVIRNANRSRFVCQQLSRQLNNHYDRVLVISPGDGQPCYFGNPRDFADLLSFFPGLALVT